MSQMFRDPYEDLDDEWGNVLEDYTLEEILDENSLTLSQALTLLTLGGHIVFPEVKGTDYSKSHSESFEEPIVQTEED